MRREIRDEILALADAKLQERGIEGLHAFIDQGCTVFEKLAEILSPMRTRKGLLEMLDRVEMCAEEEKYAVAATKYFGHFVRECLSALLELGIKELPPAPQGRRRTLTPELAEQICSYILALYAKETEMTICKQRAAQRFGVSLTTVHRAWRNRGKVQAQEVDACELVGFVRKKLSDGSWLAQGESASAVVAAEYKSLVHAGTGERIEPR